jgi:SpoVK/Ycf46/Vps4 family AAA+-type ATPase
MKSGIVGSSGERLRMALSVIDAVSGGRSLWLATCNSIGTLPPELRRRFTLGTFFFDLPSPEERAAIWQIYTAKYQIGGPRPQDDNWTGAEIKECCRKAYRLRMSLVESAAYIVPVARSASEQIENLRQQSSGKYLSASHPGVYEYNKIAAATKGRALRQLAGE